MPSDPPITSGGSGSQSRPDPLDELVVLNRRQVATHLPSVLNQIELVRTTYDALDAGDVEMPPKIGVHPRPDAFNHAMPSFLMDKDVLALKWVSGYPDNPAKGIPYIQGIVVVNDADTGTPLAILDGAEVTAARTAAASALCVAGLAEPNWRSVAIIGCGEQGRYHASALAALNPEIEIRAFDPKPERANALHPNATTYSTMHEAVRDASVVVSACPLSVERGDPIGVEMLSQNCLLLPIDFDYLVGPQLLESCSAVGVDNIEQYNYYRSLGYFGGWPDIETTTGALLRGARPAGRVLVANLGVGALDAAFAAATLTNHQADEI